jgi:hypothetical protein
MTTKFSISRQKGDAAVSKAMITGVSVSGARVVGARLLGPSAMGPLAIAVSAVGAIAIGRLTIANAVIRRLRAQEIEIASLKVGTLEVAGQRWPETAGGSEPPAVAPGAFGTPVAPETPDMPGPTMGTAGDVAATTELGETGGRGLTATAV